MQSYTYLTPYFFEGVRQFFIISLFCCFSVSPIGVLADNKVVQQRSGDHTIVLGGPTSGSNTIQDRVCKGRTGLPKMIKTK